MGATIMTQILDTFDSLNRSICWRQILSPVDFKESRFDCITNITLAVMDQLPPSATNHWFYRVGLCHPYSMSAQREWWQSQKICEAYFKRKLTNGIYILLMMFQMATHKRLITGTGKQLGPMELTLQCQSDLCKLQFWQRRPESMSNSPSSIELEILHFQGKVNDL